MAVNACRIRKLKDGNGKKDGPVLYWMSRDQRSEDNWALLFAQEKALKGKNDLMVIFCLNDSFLGATLRQFSFMLDGLKEVHETLKKKNIYFNIIQGAPYEVLPLFIDNYGISSVVTDFDPLRIKKEWKKRLLKKIDIDVYEVDTHNIVPCWLVSDKAEYGAYTIRPKIKRKLDQYMEDFPRLKKMGSSKIPKPYIRWKSLYSGLHIDRSIKEVDWLSPGSRKAFDVLGVFIEKRLSRYMEESNDPSKKLQSDLSPYLHFGSISSQRITLEIEKLDMSDDVKWSFLEELVIRKELSDNYCNYNEKYDSPGAFPGWAKKTLDDHIGDKRGYLYTLDEFEDAKTHDPLWNACQKEMVYTGKMQGYMRMYWAKKILEWTKDYRTAMKTAIYLNDKYELDGRDPNGYTGIAWSIGGLHDRAWKEREVFGKIRYMSYNGAKSKFDIASYIKKHL